MYCSVLASSKNIVPNWRLFWDVYLQAHKGEKGVHVWTFKNADNADHLCYARQDFSQQQLGRPYIQISMATISHQRAFVGTLSDSQCAFCTADP